MKRLLPLLLVFVLLLGGCTTGEHAPVHTVVDGQNVVIRFDTDSITSGTVTAENGDVYRFEPAYANATYWLYSFTYPDGSNGLDASGYLDISSLTAAIEDAQPLTFVDIPFPLFIIGLIAGSLGIWLVVDPERGWLFRYHHYVNSYTELSSYQLWLSRVIGVVLLVAAAVSVILGFVKIFA